LARYSRSRYRTGICGRSLGPTRCVRRGCQRGRQTAPGQPKPRPPGAHLERGMVVSPVGFEPTTRGLKVSLGAVHGVLRAPFLSMAHGDPVHRNYRVGPTLTAVAVNVAVKRRPERVSEWLLVGLGGSNQFHLPPLWPRTRRLQRPPAVPRSVRTKRRWQPLPS
jgi:hypothetical protein